MEVGADARQTIYNTDEISKERCLSLGKHSSSQLSFALGIPICGIPISLKRSVSKGRGNQLQCSQVCYLDLNCHRLLGFRPFNPLVNFWEKVNQLFQLSRSIMSQPAVKLSVH